MKRKKAMFKLPVCSYGVFPFIHGLFHLKGYDHNDTMERQERYSLRTFVTS